ncbi:MAG: hypothetical protein ACTHJR_11055 [Sphingomonas sp.]|uniref:hypothetical protein n=1 Tax=Sphingomonas sp. TaxID=28214 RepID=UPI003F7D64AE
MSWFDQPTAVPRLIGSAIFRWVSIADLDIEYDFEWLYVGPVKGRQRLSVEPKARGAIKHRMLFSCPGCGQTVQRLFCRTVRWECQTCQDLKPRSVFVPKRIRDAEELSGLRELLRYGRPPNMRMARYLRLVERRDEMGDRVTVLAERAPRPLNLRVDSSFERDDWYT